MEWRELLGTHGLARRLPPAVAQYKMSGGFAVETHFLPQRRLGAPMPRASPRCRESIILPCCGLRRRKLENASANVLKPHS